MGHDRIVATYTTYIANTVPSPTANTRIPIGFAPAELCDILALYMPVRCEVREGTFVVVCMGTYSSVDYQRAIEDAASTAAFVAGMPVLLDIRQSDVVVGRDDYERRCACLAALAAPGASLWVAVLTREERMLVTLRALDGLARPGIIAGAFTSRDTAEAWLRTQP